MSVFYLALSLWLWMGRSYISGLVLAICGIISYTRGW